MKGHYSNILVPTDFSGQSLLALDQAYALAKILNVEITLLHVMEEGSGIVIPNLSSLNIFSKDDSEAGKEEEEKVILKHLEEIARKASKSSWIKVNPLLVKGKTSEKIVEIARDIYARFIVMAANSSDPEHKKNNIGSHTQGVLRNSPCPVLTFNGANIRNQFDTIILPLDLTKETQQKVIRAIEIAKYYNSTIRILSVLLTTEPDVVSHITNQMNEARDFIEKRDVYASCKIVYGDKVMGNLISYILDYAYENEGDLLMIMVKREDRLERLLGSNTVEMLSRCKIPVLSVFPKTDHIR